MSVICGACNGTGRTITRPTLTERQLQMLDWIREYIKLNIIAPTHEEIRDAFGYNTLSTVHEHLHNLQRKGYITIRRNRQRAITIVGEEVPS